MKQKFLFVFVLLAMLMISGCNADDKKLGTLSAPQEITVQSDGNKSLIIFDEVENAQYYNIYINDMAVTVRGNGSGIIQFDASKILTSPQKYTIKVKAGSDKYFESKFSSDYEYTHTRILPAPIISIDGTTLNWSKVPNAEFYDVLVSTSNPMREAIHRFQCNTFNFSNILVNKGEYVFKVRAVSENNEYLTSIYSNQVKYTHSITLTTPYNLKIYYDVASEEMLLSFISSENVDSFVISIDGNNYSVTQEELNRFLLNDDFDNLYTLKLSSFMRYKNIAISNTRLFNLSVKAVTNNQYLKSSSFSNPVECQYTSVLETPEISITKTSTTCKLNINTSSSQYLSSYAIYLNDVKYKTLLKEINEIEIPLSVIGAAGIRVQAISNNNNCHSSGMSEAKYIDDSTMALADTNIAYANNILNWTAVENATNYYVEISNLIFSYAKFTTDLSIDLSQICKFNQYNVRVIAFADGYKQSEISTNINYTTKISTVESPTISSVGDITYLNFDEVKNAYGYVIYLNGVMVNRIFSSSPININSYVSDANSYAIKVQAVGLESGISDSDLSAEQVLQNIKTLSAPTLTIIKEMDRYYLNVNVNESENALSAGCEVWINYVSLGVQAYQDLKIDITSYFISAGQYNFMAKALAVENNLYIKDSNIASTSYTCTKQLDTVTDIAVTQLADESKYILTFKEQTLAAKYIVNIVKADDDTYAVEFELNNGFADISQYVVNNGIYKVYVKAIALDDSFYTDSATSGNPFRLVKGLTLPIVKNIAVNKSGAGIVASWDKVQNSTGYQVNIYYTLHTGSKVLKLSVETQNTSLEIGQGQYGCLNKEGVYIVQIKALGDNNLYENSQITTYSYNYIMETLADFNRNKVFMYGNVYDYEIASITDLQYLLWYHYLYNEQTWKYDGSLEYNLKVYCSKNLDDLALSYSETLAQEISSLTTKAQKMHKIASKLLSEYPEIAAYTLGLADSQGYKIHDFCLNETENVYMFRYENVLNDDKLDKITTTDAVFGDKLDIVDTFEQRSTNYVFAIDKLDSIDVTTTEQLFMAVQYNKRPNFVGDCGVARAVYENAKFVLRQLCSDGMNEYQKTLQIYDFLIKCVAYNHNVTLGGASAGVMSDDGVTMRGNIRDFYLEGVLYNSKASNGMFTSLDEFIGQTAVCDGLAKAYVLLCSIEGIDCIKVEGTTNGGGHSWNKVYIDADGSGVKKWYSVDLTNSRTNITFSSTNYQIGLHNYFLVSDVQLTNMFNAQIDTWHKRMGEETENFKYTAQTGVDYYDKQKYSYKYSETVLVSNKNLKVADGSDAEALIMCARLRANKTSRVVIEIDAAVYIAASGVNTLISNITSNYYINITAQLGGQYKGNIDAKAVGNIVAIIFEPSGV